ncbi:MAG: hypothetical protein KHZ62_04520 [Clostridiales bacterium]|nr:hypothetical protein [Clostridiales bacterium]
MKLMHTKLPEFIRKMKAASCTAGRFVDCKVVGLENLKTAKMQSARTGKIEEAIREMVASHPEIYNVQLDIIPRRPESMHSCVIRSWDKDGNPVECVMQTINILHPTEEILTHDFFGKINDMRPAIGRH